MVGRRKILLLSQLGTLVSWAIFLAAFLLPTHVLIELDSPTLGQFALTLPLIVLFVARAADGLTGANVSVANAYLADITEEDQRSENFGKMAMSGNLGFILGPAVAGLLGATIWGEVLPVVAALVVSLIASLVIAFGLKESNPCVLLHDPQPRSNPSHLGEPDLELGFRLLCVWPDRLGIRGCSADRVMEWADVALSDVETSKTRRPGLPGSGSRVCQQSGCGCQYCRFGSRWTALQLARTVGVQCLGAHGPDRVWAGSKSGL